MDETGPRSGEGRFEGRRARLTLGEGPAFSGNVRPTRVSAEGLLCTTVTSSVSRTHERRQRGERLREYWKKPRVRGAGGSLDRTKGGEGTRATGLSEQPEGP